MILLFYKVALRYLSPILSSGYSNFTQSTHDWLVHPAQAIFLLLYRRFLVHVSETA